MTDLTCDDIADMMEGERLTHEMRAARKLLRFCSWLLPQGLLCDTVRQVSEGRSAADALLALEEMGGGNDG